MKINNFNKLAVSKISLLLATVIVAASCNKPLPDAMPIIYGGANASTVSLGSVINSDTTYSIYKAAATRVGALAMLSDSTKVFTIFLPNNAAFRASGIASEVVIGLLPITSVGGIVQYSIIPGEQFLSTDTTLTRFPNLQLPTALTIGVLPGTTVPLKMTIFPSKRSNGFWANNIPVVAPDLKFQNGVIHLVGAVVAPPAQTLKGDLYSNPNLTFFKAAIARADSGASGLNKLDSLLGYGVTNMTVLAPNDAAFQTLLFGLIYTSLKQGPDSNYAAQIAQALSATPAVFSNPALYSVITPAMVKGILAYHFLATIARGDTSFKPNIRVFSNNFATTPGVFYTTLVNSSVPPLLQPGVMAQATFTGPFVSSLQFKGAGTFPPGGAPYSGAAANALVNPATGLLDHPGVNGNYFVIDKVLLPQ